MYARPLSTMALVCLVCGFALSPGRAHATEFLFKDPEYSFQCLRAISQSVSGGADIREVLDTAARIKEGDDESWYTEWHATAERLERTADRFLGEGRKVSAREAYFRASNYYRSAEFFLHNNPRDPRILSTWRKSRDCFLKGAELSATPIKPVKIPFERTTLPGYLCLADNSGRRRPLLIIQTGFDGTGEELYFLYAYAALQRGYHCLIFEGPGQGQVIREQQMIFRPDWETVVTPVVDFAVKQKGVDPARIALMGISMGGYLAPRAAAFEHRVKALIANGGIYDFHTPFVKSGPPNIEAILDSKEGSEAIDRLIATTMRAQTSVRWMMNDGMWKFGAKSPSDFMRKTRPYNMKDVAEKILCPTLIVDSEGDKNLAGQAQRLYDALRCQKEFMLFTNREAAGEHCQEGAKMISNERVLNWLDGVFGKKKSR